MLNFVETKTNFVIVPNTIDRSYINDLEIAAFYQQLDMLLFIDAGNPLIYLHNPAPNRLKIIKTKQFFEQKRLVVLK